MRGNGGMTNTQQQIDEPRRNRRTPKGDVSLLACPYFESLRFRGGSSILWVLH